MTPEPGNLEAFGVVGFGIRTSMEIPAGTYLMFRARSRSPEDIRDAWLGVYDYFASHRDCVRAYQADFDKHSDIGVELYIGVKKAPKQ